MSIAKLLIVLIVAGATGGYAASGEEPVLRDVTYVMPADGVGSVEVQAPASFQSAKSFTAVVWVALQEKPSKARMTLLADDAWSLSVGEDGLFSFCSTAKKCVRGSHRAQVRTLYQVAARIQDGKRAAVFVNGKREASGPLRVEPGAGPLTVAWDGKGSVLNGAILEVKLFDQALSEDRLAQLPGQSGICEGKDLHEHLFAGEDIKAMGSHHHHPISHPHASAPTHHHAFVDVPLESIQWLCGKS